MNVFQGRHFDNERCVFTEGDDWISPVSVFTFQSGSSEQLSIVVQTPSHKPLLL